MRERRHRRLQRLCDGNVVEDLELAGAHIGAAVAEFQDVLELASEKIKIDIVGDGADQLQREEPHRKREAVRQLHGYDVAASDADAAEELGASLDLALELSIGDAAAGIGEHLAVGMRAGPLLDYLEEALVQPQPGRSILRPKLALQHGRKLHILLPYAPH